MERVKWLIIFAIIVVLFSPNVFGSDPFGSLDTPGNNSTARGVILVTGWVLDDVEVSNVHIYNGATFLGSGMFVEGARPDVAAIYPHYPNSQKAGWSYSLVTNFLPDGGNSSYVITVIASDNEGNRSFHHHPRQPIGLYEPRPRKQWYKLW